MDEIRIASLFNPLVDFVIFEGDVKDLLSDIPDEFVQLVVTSPPYNIGKPYERKKIKFDDYIEQQEAIISECVRILSNKGSICWQVGNYIDKSEIIPLDIVLFPIFKKFGLHLRNRIVWYFGHGLHASKRFSGRYEVILWFTKTNNYYFNFDSIRIPQKYPQKKYYKGPKKGELSGNPHGKNPSDIWEIPNVKANHIEKTIHPCQFPVELVERLVLSLTEPGDWIFDPFMGVGSTAIAALLHQRKAIGAEIIHEYSQLAIKRVHDAESGKLRIRPMERPIYDPNDKDNYIPPINVQLKKSSQQMLFERRKRYKKGGKK
jgi:adenine-specific DNA-methyltransferase